MAIKIADSAIIAPPPPPPCHAPTKTEIDGLQALRLVMEGNSTLPRPHSYLVLEDLPGEYRRGALVEWSGGGYGSHSHWALKGHEEAYYSASIRDSDLAPLTEEECVILGAISIYASRYAVYSTPGKLEWGVGLKVGDTVLVRLLDSEVYVTAIIRWIGEDEYGDHLFGVEIEVSDVV